MAGYYIIVHASTHFVVVFRTAPFVVAIPALSKRNLIILISTILGDIIHHRVIVILQSSHRILIFPNKKSSTFLQHFHTEKYGEYTEPEEIRRFWPLVFLFRGRLPLEDCWWWRRRHVPDCLEELDEQKLKFAFFYWR